MKSAFLVNKICMKTVSRNTEMCNEIFMDWFLQQIAVLPNPLTKLTVDFGLMASGYS